MFVLVSRKRDFVQIDRNISGFSVTNAACLRTTWNYYDKNPKSPIFYYNHMVSRKDIYCVVFSQCLSHRFYEIPRIDIASLEITCAHNIYHFNLFVCLFDLILYVPSTIFQLNRDGSSWVEPVLS